MLKIPCDQVVDHVVKLHTRPQDFEEGDLLRRLDRFTVYVAKPIHLALIDFRESPVFEDKVQECMRLYLETKSYPRLVFDEIDGSMLDGLHRAHALYRCGLKVVDAFVGTGENVNPNWTEPDLEEDAEDSSEEEI